MKTVNEAQKAIFNRVATILQLDKGEFEKLMSSEGATELPESLISEEKLNSVITTEFAFADKSTYDIFHKKISGETMNTFDETSRRVFSDALKQSSVFEGDITSVMNAFDDKAHKRSMNRIFAAVGKMAEIAGEKVKTAGTAPDDLKAQIQATQKRANELQLAVDGFDERVQSEVDKVEKGYKEKLISMNLRAKASGLGAKFPSDTFANYWIKDRMNEVDFVEEGGKLSAFQKGTQNPLVDAKTQASISTDEYLKNHLVDFMERNNGGDKTPVPPKLDRKPGTPDGLPEGITPGSAQAHNWKIAQERQQARNGVSA